MREYAFEKLDVWQKSRGLCNEIYKLTGNFPKSEVSGLSSQMRRAAISVCSNIAEGASRSGEKERIQFYRIAYSSLMELLNQIIITHDLELLDNNKYQELRDKIEPISLMLYVMKKRS